MIIPIRCYTCNKLIGHLYEPYKKMIKENNISNDEAFIKIGFKRYCCKRMFLGHVDLIDTMINYNINLDK